MSRSIHFLVRLVQRESISAACTVASVRLFGSTGPGGHPGVYLDLELHGHGDPELLQSIFHEVGLNVEDLIQIDDSCVPQKLIAVVSNIANFLGSNKHFRIFFANETHVAQGAIVQALRKHTIFGMPSVFYSQKPISEIKFYIGANKNRVDLNLENHRHSLRSLNGYPYTFEITTHGRVELFYLDARGALQHKESRLDCYYSEDIQQKINRYQFRNKLGLTIYGLFPISWVECPAPLIDQRELTDLINRESEAALNDMLMQQVRRIEERIRNIPRRRRVRFRGSVLGLEPQNEHETVILFERYVAANNGRIGSASGFRLLEYSPQGIDSICEFSPSPNIPFNVVAVEFEYHLRNFFSHGHDPCQVKLILCYSLAGLSFPYDHYGVLYTIDRTAELPRLINMETGEKTFLFALEEVVESA